MTYRLEVLRPESTEWTPIFNDGSAEMSTFETREEAEYWDEGLGSGIGDVTRIVEVAT